MIKEIKKIYDRCERIGVIGSPSSTSELSIDILGTAVNKKLVGNLCVFNFNQDGNEHFALGQIVEVDMRNPWVEDPTMRSLIRQKGVVEPVTERQDFHLARMTVGSVFSVSDAVQPSTLGTVPSTGTSVRLMERTLLDYLLNEYKKDIVFLGNAYGTDIPLPTWFKSFGNEQGGVGEAFHIGIFGKTGSGKSVLAKMIMLSYAKNESMNIFILDPQGEFTKLKNDNVILTLINKGFNKNILFYSIQDLVLTGENLLKRILAKSQFFDKLGVVHSDNKSRASEQVIKIIKKKRRNLESYAEDEIKPWEYYKKEVFDLVWNEIKNEDVIKNIYSQKEGQDRVRSAIEGADVNEMYNMWSSILKLFSYEGNSNKIKINDLIEKLGDSGKGKIIVIDLSDESSKDLYWNDGIRKIVIDKLLDSLKAVGENYFKSNRLLNTLVIIDEAHRLAPRDLNQDDEVSIELRSLIIDSILTTRKYGLGWMFISQTLSGLHKDIISQLRIYFFGYGLAYGTEYQSLREIIGGADYALNLYKLFKDPQSGFGKKEYPFMAFGPVSPLSFSGYPLFFSSYNFPEEFIKNNFSEVLRKL
ncbi:ATP-binding protein [Caldisericum sp.]|uniref:ATP-binding protein n=1 Tax=Caldisericum sp. TaxID=2499687 RepID=UPI003D0F317C